METTAIFALQLNDVLFLAVVGFIGGMVSGFIGSGGAFVLTPAMMSMGVPAQIAVASNIAHKFPKALVGAIKRNKYGHVDVKLGIVMGLFAEFGIILGKYFMEDIKHSFGDVGTNLYVSFIFVVVLAIVGAWVLHDAWKLRAQGHAEEKVTKLAKWVQSIHIPGTMMYFNSLKAKVSVLFIVPLGFATGLLAATIAVGGFIGVPAMIYVLGAPALMATATELVIAFIMGVLGTALYGWAGYVDIRLAMIILLGSLFGIQIGAIGTTYVTPFVVKLVMGTIMVTVLVSRFFYIPGYLSHLHLIQPLQPNTLQLLDKLGFYTLILALGSGGFIVIGALIRGMVAHKKQVLIEEESQLTD